MTLIIDEFKNLIHQLLPIYHYILFQMNKAVIVKFSSITLTIEIDDSSNFWMENVISQDRNCQVSQDWQGQ